MMGRPGRGGLPLTHPVDKEDAQKPTPWLVQLGGRSARALRDQWVWRSSPESFERGQRSVLAAAEIPFSMVVFWGVIARSPWPWMTVMGMLAAPLLLLRSPESIARGVDLLRQYWLKGAGPLPELPQDGAFGQWVDRPGYVASSAQRLAIRAAVSGGAWVVITLAFVVVFGFMALITYAFVEGRVIARDGLPVLVFLWTMSLVIVTVSAFVFVYAVQLVFELLLMFAFALVSRSGLLFAFFSPLVLMVMALIVFVDRPDVAVEMSIGFLAAIGVAIAVAAAVLTALVSLVISFRRMPMGADGNPILVFCYVLGVFLRGLVLRVAATLRELLPGLRHYPGNCRESVLVVDVFHVPELMPHASTVSSELDLVSYWRRAGLTAQNKPWQARWIEWALKLFFSLLIYMPALAYRLNLKANAWLWGLIAWVFSPDRWSTEERQRESVQFWSTYLLLGLLASALVVVVPWLIWPWVSARVPADALNELKSWIALWPIPVGSLRHIMLCILAVALTGLLVAAYRVRSTHGKALESANDFANYLPEAKERALLMAGHVRRWLMACTAFTVFTAWVFLLWAAANLTDRYKDVVWAWLRPLL